MLTLLKSTLVFAVMCAMLSIDGATSLTFPWNSNTKIQVCQNKDCSQRWTLQYQPLSETFLDLLSPDAMELLDVESTSCLGECGKGPNLSIKKQGSKEIFLHGVSGAMGLADELEEKLDISIPSKLVAAVTVMEKAHQAPLAEKERFYNSVVQVLNNDPMLSSSCAHARALVLRAVSREEEGNRYEEAIQDSLAALRIPHASQSIKALACRTLADCYRSKGDFGHAIQALEQWAVVDPSFRTKVQLEIGELKRQASQ